MIHRCLPVSKFFELYITYIKLEDVVFRNYRSINVTALTVLCEIILQFFCSVYCMTTYCRNTIVPYKITPGK